MNRRQALKALASIPVSAPVLAHTITTQAHLPVAGVAGNAVSGSIRSGLSAPKPKIFTSFSDWLIGAGLKQLREEAKYIRQIDADIISMRLPLATKHRMQQRRNLNRLIEDRRSWFSETIKRDGRVEYYQ